MSRPPAPTPLVGRVVYALLPADGQQVIAIIVPVGGLRLRAGDPVTILPIPPAPSPTIEGRSP